MPLDLGNSSTPGGITAQSAPAQSASPSVGEVKESGSSTQVFNPTPIAQTLSAPAVIVRPSAWVPSQHGTGSGSTGNTAFVSEQYRSLVDKAYQKFARLRELPPYGRNKWDLNFHKAFQIYSRLWKFQQENRQKLVETGLTRWEIGEIASRIGQLYYNYYLRTSEATFLFESYIFYEAIMTREYFKENGRDVNLANKQLRYAARFIVVCLLLNRREMVRKLLRQLRILVDEYGRSFQAADAREWKLVVQEIVRFMKSDASCDSSRPLRYSLLLDAQPCSLASPIALPAAYKPLKLQEAVLTSYYHNEVKFSELTLDTFRMLQAVEYDPTGSNLKTRSGDGGSSSRSGGGGEEAIVDPTVPPNPHKYILYRPSVPQLLLVLATACEELPPDSVLLVYISASGLLPRAAGGSSLAIPYEASQVQSGTSVPPGSGPTAVLDPIPERASVEEIASVSDSTAAEVRGGGSRESHSEAEGGTIGAERLTAGEDGSVSSGREPSSIPAAAVSGTGAGRGPTWVRGGGVWLGSRREASREGAASRDKASVRLPGDSYLYPSDLLPFTRRPLFIIIDSDCSSFFEMISGGERGEAAVLLLSPRVQPVADDRPSSSVPTTSNPMASNGGNLFTFFLTAPLLAFCRLTTIKTESLLPGAQDNAERQLSSILASWGALLAELPALDVTWARLLLDPFARHFILRFIFCRATFALHTAYASQPDYHARCIPDLPQAVSPSSDPIAGGVHKLATLLGVSDQFKIKAPTTNSDVPNHSSTLDIVSSSEEIKVGENLR